MSFEKYEYYVDEASYTELSPYDELNGDYSECRRRQSFEYYHQDGLTPDVSFADKFSTGDHEALHFNTSKLPCYIVPVVYQAQDNTELFRCNQNRIYSTPSQFNQSQFSSESKDHFDDTMDEDDDKTIYTEYIDNTVVSEDSMTFADVLTKDKSDYSDSGQELESIYTSNFMYDSTITDNTSQSTLGPINVCGISNQNTWTESTWSETPVVDNRSSTAAEETTLDSLDKFLIQIAKNNDTKNNAATTTPSLISYFIDYIFKWLKYIPIYSYKYCLRYILFI